MSESSLWSYLRDGMRGRWTHARRHEDLIGSGVSDVSYYHRGNSWIELKEVKQLPKRATTGISLGRYHKDESQRHWLIMRKGWLLVRVNYPKRYYLLFSYDDLPPFEKPYWTWNQMIHHCFIWWRYKIDFDKLDKILKDPK